MRDSSERLAFQNRRFSWHRGYLPFGLTDGEKSKSDLGIPLTDVAKFNVKGEVLVHKKDGELVTFSLQEAMENYQRPECQHCADFSAELADIACGGVGTRGWTIVVLRTEKGKEIWSEFEKEGLVEIQPMQENRRAWNILHILARRQRNRVPTLGPRSGTPEGLPQYDPFDGAGFVAQSMVDSPKTPEELEECLDTAYGDEARPEGVRGFLAGQPIPDTIRPTDPPPGEAQLPPPRARPGRRAAGWEPQILSWEHSLRLSKKIRRSHISRI